MTGLRFLWWNVQSFVHYMPIRRGRHAPESQAAYDAKLLGVVRVLRQLFGDAPPEVVALGEVTQKAAEDLRDRWAPSHDVFSLDLDPDRPDIAVAFLYNHAVGTFDGDQIVAPRTNTETQDMGVLDYFYPGNRIRFIACHWTSRMAEDSERTRVIQAETLSDQIYRFMRAASAGERRHVVVLGDLNTEPYGMLEQHLFAMRDRGPSRDPLHRQDHAVGRVWLYNCSWRFVGERFPHMGGMVCGESAGTYFWDKDESWHTFDQLIVTGSLLTENPPFLDEMSVRVLAHPVLVDTYGRPTKFEWTARAASGLSDHLPVYGCIVLERETDHG